MVNVRSMIALYAGKFSKQVLKLINSSGTALPGKLALRIDNNFLDNIEEKCDTVIMVTGTNGKTTTAAGQAFSFCMDADAPADHAGGIAVNRDVRGQPGVCGIPGDGTV